MIKPALMLVAALAAGAAGGFAAARLQMSAESPPINAPATPTAPAATAPARATLPARADAQTLQRDAAALAREVAGMRRELDDLTANLAERVQTAMRADIEERVETRRARFAQTPEEQVQQLVSSGFAPDRAQGLIDRLGQAEMQRLYARDRATREGQSNEEFRAELAKIEDPMEAIRSELRAEEYDAFLFATGQRNRVQVGDVLADSPALAAGVRSGDVLYALGGERVFARDDIARIAAGGNAGESVTLTVVRDGELVDTVVPRGPLGVTAIPRVADPAAGPAVIEDAGPPWGGPGTRLPRGFGRGGAQ